MIDVNKITGRDPVVDFKFKNWGTGSAYIWKIRVELDHFVPNNAPSLRCYSVVKGNDLILSVENRGWGPAEEVELAIDDLFLGKLFPTSFFGRQKIISGGTVQYVLSLNNMDSSAKETLAQRIHSNGPVYFTDLYVGLQFVSESGQRTELRRVFVCHPPRSRDYLCKLDRTGFVAPPEQQEQMNQQRQQPALIVIAAIFDYSTGRHSKEYRTSVVVPPGDVGRFQIALSSNRSFSFRAKFSFFVDDSPKPLETDSLTVSVWNPRGSRSQEIEFIEDGDQFVLVDGVWKLADEHGQVTRRPN